MKTTNITMMKNVTFSDRILRLVEIYGIDALAFYLHQDAPTIGKWSNSETLVEAPVNIDYTYFLYKNPEFNELWLKEGMGDVFKNGTYDENVKTIKEREFKKKLAESQIM